MIRENNSQNTPIDKKEKKEESSKKGADKSTSVTRERRGGSKEGEGEKGAEKREERENEMIKIGSREPLFEFKLTESGKRTALLLENGIREKRSEKLEEFVKAVQIEKPKKELEPLYAPIYQEKTEAKYISTASTEKILPVEEQTKPRGPVLIREARTPMLRETSIAHWEEVTKYEAEKPEIPTGFEPAFKHPERKITKYKPRY